MARPTGEGLLGRGGGVHVVESVARRGHPSQLRVAHRGEHHAVVGDEHRQHREQALLDRGRLERGEQAHQRSLPAEGLHRAGEGRPVGLGDLGYRPAEGVLEPAGRVAGTREPQPRADAPVAGHDVDAVSRSSGERGEQQRGLHRGVQAGYVVDAAGGDPRGVEHQDDAPVALGLPGADHDVAVARRGAPVDGADVVAADVLAQRVELRALAAHAHRRSAVQVAQPRQPRRQVLARLERRQRPQRRRAPVRVRCRAARPSGP